MVSPVFTATEARLHGTFSALLWSLSNPGRIERLLDEAQDPIVAIGEALVDLETTYYSPEPSLASRLERTGSRWAPPHRARYHFYPTLLSDDLTSLEVAPTGTYTYPDDSATIVVGCSLYDPDLLATVAVTRVRLTGPGVREATILAIAGVPDEIWSVRERVIRYPLGWDLFLVSDNRVVGVPRTSTAEVLR
jgi:alpha-D-ribose 1-methylphosphonate 5-triphosphate synthase subunit PhnH